MLAGSECSELEAMVATAVPGVAAVGGPEPEACWLSATRGARHVGVTAPHCAASSVGNEIRQPLRRSICEQPDVTLRQTEVRLRSARLMVSRPVRQRGDVARARDRPRPPARRHHRCSGGMGCRQSISSMGRAVGSSRASTRSSGHSPAGYCPKPGSARRPTRPSTGPTCKHSSPVSPIPHCQPSPTPPPPRARFRLVGLIVRVLCCASVLMESPVPVHVRAAVVLTGVIWFQTVKRSAISCRHPVVDSRCRRGRKCGEMWLNADRNRCACRREVNRFTARSRCRVG
jgi:hypothetical protein